MYMNERNPYLFQMTGGLKRPSIDAEQQQYTVMQPTLVINLYGDEVPAAGVVGDADPALVELEAGYLADVDVV